MTDPTNGNLPSDTERHNAKMARKKQARDKIMATKTNEKGLVIVHTGKGKGKSSAAFGMIFRCIAHKTCSHPIFCKLKVAHQAMKFDIVRFCPLVHLSCKSPDSIINIRPAIRCKV